MTLNFSGTITARVLVLYVLCSLSLLVSPIALASTTKHLNGIGTYNHMGKDYYLVAHYTAESCDEALQCEESKKPARFLLKIITPRWTAHSYSLVWQRELSSNNDSPLGKTDMDALLAFTRIAETQLTYGDTIDLVFDGSDTTIAVNKVFAVRATGKTLFNYISRVWLGPVPPSREFKQSMLAGHHGLHDQTTLSLFKSIHPNPNRMALLDTWHAKKDTPIKRQQPRKTVSATTKSQSSASSQATEDSVKNHNLNSTPITNTKDAPSAIPAKVEIAREQQLATLEWHIHNAIFKRVTYPAWARQFAQEGSVSVTFTLDDSLAVLSIDGIEPSHAGLLGEAVVNAIESSQPFTYPAGITTEVDTLTSTYQHDFSLTQVAKPPSIPAGISEATFEQLLSGETRENIAPASIDIDALRAHVNHYVKYPYWAKSLKLKGNVKALITLNAQGLLEDVTIMEGSRHAGFNQAIKDAAKKAAPYPVTPQPADTDTLISFDYQHVFTP